jgi:hypothetical protein
MVEALNDETDRGDRPATVVTFRRFTPVYWVGKTFDMRRP